MAVFSEMTGYLKTMAERSNEPPIIPVFNVQNERFEHEVTPRLKPSKQLQKAIAWVKENDPSCKLTVREAARLAGVSVGTMHKARE